MLQEVLSKFSTPADKQDYLLQLTAAHPYFAPAQFCLLQTLQPGTEAYNQRAAIVHLLYNNAHWLQYQMGRSTSPERYQPKATVESTDNQTVPVGKDVETDTAMDDEPVAETPVAEVTSETTEAQTADTDTTTNAEPVTETSVTEITSEATDIQPTDTDTATNAEPIAETPVAEITDEATEVQQVDTNTDTTANAESVAEAPAVNEETGTQSTATAEVDNEPLLFEPLFAVDYFASQGIKLTDEPQANDKLGLQLKSFTDWLKSLKKSQEPRLEALNTAAEAAVQTIAEKSNTEDDVVTEAMAEVFALQGRRQKAADIYRKLSLLNPHKSAYFAAKIENLK